jgi:hypothetical protein
MYFTEPLCKKHIEPQNLGNKLNIESSAYREQYQYSVNHFSPTTNYITNCMCKFLPALTPSQKS